jgi:hypothetical protein
MTTIPRGHAMPPLLPADITSFLHTYFRAEYAPIRSFFSTATAIPPHPTRWCLMGTELSPSVFRPANAQAQKDLETLDDFIRKNGLDATFVRGLVIRYARFEVHERLEKKLYESCREDLMVRKALKEKHLIEALWPASSIKFSAEHVAQGKQVRAWYGDMFAKYFRYLRSLDDYKLRPEVEDRIRRVSQLNLVPFVEHLVFGPIEPILPMSAKGAVQPSATSSGGADLRSQGKPDRFEIRFDVPSRLVETQTRSVVRTTECLKCGSKRDVTVVISVDPAPGPVEKTSRHTHSQSHGVLSNTSAPLMRRDFSASKAAAKYSPEPEPAFQEKRAASTHHHTRNQSSTGSGEPLPYSDALEHPLSPPSPRKAGLATSTQETRPLPVLVPNRHSLSLSLLNLKWPRSSTSTPSHQPSNSQPQIPDPQPLPPRLSNPKPEMTQRGPTPPPSYSQEVRLTQRASPNLLPLSPPSVSLLDTVVPLSPEIEDEAAVYWGVDSELAEEVVEEPERARKSAELMLDLEARDHGTESWGDVERAEEEAEPERGRTPVILELGGEGNVWGDE